MNLIQVARLRALAGSLGAEFVTYKSDALKLRLNPKYVQDPVLLYKGMVLPTAASPCKAAKGRRCCCCSPLWGRRRALRGAQ